MRYPETALPAIHRTRPADPRTSAARLVEGSGTVAACESARRILDARGWTWRNAFSEWCASQGRDPAAELARLA